MAKKILAVFLSIVLSAQLFVIGVSAKGKKYIIVNPYEKVAWDEWGSYKFQPHCHTNASDGYLTVKESVQMHYDLNYDIVALTDHGTINKGWNQKPDLVPLIRLVKYDRTHMAPIIPLTDEEYESYQSGTAPSAERTHKNGMLDVPQGIELNMATPKADCHLTGYFSDYGQGLAGVYGDYETPSKGVREAGGISMLSHVGEYVYPEDTPVIRIGYSNSAEFTSREFDIIRELVQGRKYEEISADLDITPNTVKYHIKNILQKTGYQNTLQLVAEVVEKRLILPRY